METSIKDKLINILKTLYNKEILKLYMVLSTKEYVMILSEAEESLTESNKWSKFNSKGLNCLAQRLYRILYQRGYLNKIGDVKNNTIKIISVIRDFIFLNHVIVDGYVYYPNINIKPHSLIVERNKKSYLNTYENSGILCKRKLKNYKFSTIQKILLSMLSNNQEHYNWFVNLLAHKIQNPFIKHPIVIIFSGPFSVRANFIADMLYNMLGQNVVLDKLSVNSNPMPEYLFAVFNLHHYSINKYVERIIDNPLNYSTLIIESNREDIKKLQRKNIKYVVFEKPCIMDYEEINDFYFCSEKASYVEECEGFLSHLLHYSVSTPLVTI